MHALDRAGGHRDVELANLLQRAAARGAAGRRRRGDRLRPPAGAVAPLRGSGASAVRRCPPPRAPDPGGLPDGLQFLRLAAPLVVPALGTVGRGAPWPRRPLRERALRAGLPPARPGRPASERLRARAL